jgi:hypothetical protein
MSDNSVWKWVGRVLTAGEQRDGSRTGGSRCEAGHLMDPNWTVCPYCEAAKRAGQKTDFGPRFEASDRRSHVTRSPTMTPGATPSDFEGGHTRAETSADLQTGNPGQRPSNRKLTGALVTFTWRPQQGELFLIREGRNVIGSGTVESEGTRPCDVQITTDSMLSNEHAVILCRAGRYELFDRQSTNGTFMNDQFVESQGVAIPDRAKIKTGNTIWTFLRIDAGAAETASASSDQTRAPEPMPPRRSTPRSGESTVQ